MNQVERFFALLTERQVRHRVRRSAEELKAAISAFLDKHNKDPRVLTWIKSADDILGAIEG